MMKGNIYTTAMLLTLLKKKLLSKAGMHNRFPYGFIICFVNTLLNYFIKAIVILSFSLFLFFLGFSPLLSICETYILCKKR